MRRRATAALVLALALGAPAPALAARSADLDAAVRALDELRYEEAASLLERAWRSGENDPASLALLFRLQGEVAATLGDEPAARAAFARLLALDPEARLPDGSSPKIVAVFEGARADLVGRRAISIQHSVALGSTPAIVVTVSSDPLDMVAGARARFRGAGGVVGTVERRGGARIELPLPAEGRYQVTLAAIDAYGNRLVEIVEAPISVGAEPTRRRAPAAPPDRPIGTPLYAHPITWGALTLIFAGTGLTFALRAVDLQEDLDALNRDSAGHTFVEARSVEEDLRLHATLANVSFVAAGACAIVTTVLLLTHRRSPARPVVGPHGGGIVLELSF